MTRNIKIIKEVGQDQDQKKEKIKREIEDDSLSD